MREMPWAYGLAIKIPIVGYVNVAGPRAALDVLMMDWPKMKGEAYEEAKRACYAALEGVPPLEHSRDAFIAGEAEAGFTITE